MAIRVLVCGGRDYADGDAAFRALDLLHARRGIACVIHGAARGADAWGRLWASQAGIPAEAYPADWDAHGRQAGILRNAQMLSEGKPDGVVAFPGGRGTADMIQRAEAAGLKVWRPYG